MGDEDKVFAILDRGGVTFAAACRMAKQNVRKLRLRIYKSRDSEDTRLWDRYLQSLPRCDLCNVPIPDAKQRIHEGNSQQVEDCLTFCSTECQQEWHEEE